jgi:hypothetical protein
MLDFLSDGEFENGVLQNFTDIRADIQLACEHAIHAYEATPLTERTALVKVLNDVMAQIKSKGLRWPDGFLVALKQLRKGGALRLHFSRKRPPVHGDVFDGGSVLSFHEWKADLLPHRERLQRVEKMYGVPQSFLEGEEFINRVIDDMGERNDGYDQENGYDLGEQLREVQRKINAHVDPVERSRWRKS